MRQRIATPLTLLAILALPVPASLAVEWSCPDSSAGNACGQATCGDTDVTTSDALLALGAAIGSTDCSLCRCDADASGKVQASDALRILRVAVGQEVTLECEACNSLQVTLTDRFFADDVAGFARLPGGGVVGISVDGAELSWRLFDAALEEISQPAPFASSSSTPVSSVIACARPDGSFAAAWTAGVETDLPPPHDYPDPGNVELAIVGSDATSEGSFPAHSARSGMQTPMAIACHADGGVSVAWYSRCYGLRELVEGEITTYNPTCFNSSIYVRSFDAEGSPITDARLVTATVLMFANDMRVITLPDGNFLASSLGRYVLFDSEANALSSTNLSPSHDEFRHDCSAGEDRCVTLRGGGVGVHASYDATGGLGIPLKDPVSPYDPVWDIWIGPRSGRVACGEDGICLAAWHLYEERENFSEEGDFYDSQLLGIFGRAFNVYTGEAGPEVELPGTSIANAGPGFFLVGVPEGKQIVEVK